MTMTREEVLAKLLVAIAPEDLSDPAWILTLDDTDEPPLFTRFAQVRVLENLPTSERGSMLMSIALRHLVSISDLVCSIDRPTHTYYACVTVCHFDDVDSGDSPVPRVAIFVDPRYEQREGLSKLHQARSPEAIEVASWLCSLGPDVEARFVVGELWPPPPTDVRRVYVGPRRSPCDAFRSVGDRMEARR